MSLTYRNRSINLVCKSIERLLYETDIGRLWVNNSSTSVCKKGILKNFAKFTQAPVPEPPACNFTKKETAAQVLSCEFCKTFKRRFS